MAGTTGASGVSAVVVHYRGGTHLRRCLASCLAVERIHEVIVVDNEGIGDVLRATFPLPRIRIVDMATNAGFGTAANAGLDLAHGPAVLVLNQDVVLKAVAVERLLEAATEAGAWVAGPRLIDSDGQERGRKTSFPWPLAWTPPAAAGLEPGLRYAPYVVGAVLLLTPGHADLRFDPRFFMYGEDVDLCWRVWEGGGTVVQVEDASVLHVGGTATATSWSPKRAEYRVLWNDGRFVRKVAGPGAALRFAGHWSAVALRAKVARR